MVNSVDARFCRSLCARCSFCVHTFAYTYAAQSYSLNIQLDILLHLSENVPLVYCIGCGVWLRVSARVRRQTIITPHTLRVCNKHMHTCILPTQLPCHALQAGWLVGCTCQHMLHMLPPQNISTNTHAQSAPPSF